MAGKSKAGHRQRLRERFIEGEKHSRSDEALLELLLTYAIPQKDVQPLAKRLLIEFGSLSSVLDAPVDSLCSFEGIKSGVATLLKLVDWIGLHNTVNKSIVTRRGTELFSNAVLREAIDWVSNTLQTEPGKIAKIVDNSYSRGRIDALNNSQMKFHVAGELPAILSPIVDRVLTAVYVSRDLTFNLPFVFRKE